MHTFDRAGLALSIATLMPQIAACTRLLVSEIREYPVESAVVSVLPFLREALSQ